MAVCSVSRRYFGSFGFKINSLARRGNLCNNYFLPSRHFPATHIGSIPCVPKAPNLRKTFSCGPTAGPTFVCKGFDDLSIDCKQISAMSEDQDLNKYWQDRWTEGRTGWHREEVNSKLEEFYHTLGCLGHNVENNRILVPLCGKSLDMKWLYEKGLCVVGVDVAEQAAKEFFEENGFSYDVRESRDTKMYYHDERLVIYVCDFFKSDVNVIGGACDYLWDRGALVAMNYSQQQKYCQVIDSLLSRKAQGLVICVMYDTSLKEGPPYCVPKEAFHNYYSEKFTIVELANREEDELMRVALYLIKRT